MPEPSDTEIVADLAEEFVDLHRQGQRPLIDDYVRLHPHLEKQIRELFPTLLVVEDLAPDRDASIVGEEAQPLTTPTNLESLGDFRILRELGRGGMGVVYEAEQVSLGRRVALKVLQHRDLPDAKHRIRFQREARSAARLHHTNIVPVFGVGEEGQLSYYVMQLIKGVGLDNLLDELRRLKRAKSSNANGDHGVETQISSASRIAEQDELAETILVGEFAFRQPTLSHEAFDESHNGTINQNTTSEADASDQESPTAVIGKSAHLSGLAASSGSPRQRSYWGSVARIGGQVAEALQYAHEHSILHRDIKPSNLMLDSSGTVWVTDFGLAKATDQQDLTNTGDILGTLRYMPPEAFQGESDQRSDIYSLGITIFEMLALRPAFDETDRHRLISQVANHSPPRLDQIDSQIPRDLVTIVQKCIERDPDHRYQTAAELADDFQHFLNDEPITARRVSSVERLVRWSRRNRAMTAALTTIATLLILGTVASMILANQFRNQRNEADYARYVSDIQAANFHLQNNSTAMAQRILMNAPEAHRDWEWVFLANQAWRRNETHKSRAVATTPSSSAAQFWSDGKLFKYPEIVGMSGGIPDGQFTADGDQVVLASQDNALSFYSVETAERVSALVNSMQGAEMSIGAISHDGDRLVTAALTGPPLVFDLNRPKTPPRTIELASKTMSAAMDWAWSRDGKYFVSAHFDKCVRIWDADSMELMKTTDPLDEEVRNLYFDNSNELWTASNDGKVIKWSMPDGNERSEWTYPNTEGLRFLALSVESNRVIATFEDDSSFICDIGTKVAIPLSPPVPESQSANSNRRRSAVFSPDGTCVAIMRGLFSVEIYDVEKRKRLCRIDGHSAPLRSIHFSPDGTKLLTTSEEATAVVWSAQPARDDNLDLTSAAHSDAVYQIDIDSEGRRLLSGSFDATACVSDLPTGQVNTRYRGHSADVVAVDFHPDGRSAASLDRNGELHVWDSRTGDWLFDIRPGNERFLKLMGTTGGGRRGELFSFPGVLSTGLFSPNGKYLVTFQDDGMKVFDAENHGQLHVPLEGADSPGWAVFSHNSQLVTVIEMNGSDPGVWEVSTGKLLRRFEGHGLALCMASFSPVDDRIVTGGMARCIVWNARTGEQHKLEGFSGYTSSCRFSIDGRFVLTGSSDNICRIWSADSGELITTLQGHTGRIRDVRFSPDESRIVSWATDDQIIVWDTAKPKANLMISRRGPSRPLQARWTTDSKNIVTAWADGSIEIWRGSKREELPAFSEDGQEFKRQFDHWRDQTVR